MLRRLRRHVVKNSPNSKTFAQWVRRLCYAPKRRENVPARALRIYCPRVARSPGHACHLAAVILCVSSNLTVASVVSKASQMTRLFVRLVQHAAMGDVLVMKIRSHVLEIALRAARLAKHDVTEMHGKNARSKGLGIPCPAQRARVAVCAMASCSVA